MAPEDDLKATEELGTLPRAWRPHHDAVTVGPADRQLQFIFESASIGMALVRLDGTYIRANAALCALLQRSEPELQATTWQAITHPGDVMPGMAQTKRVVDGHHGVFRFEKRYLLPGGQPLWAMVTVSLVKHLGNEPSCLFVQVVDLTDHRKDEEARHRLAAIADSSVDAVIAVDLGRTIVTWNQGASIIFGYATEEAIGKDISLITAPDEHDTIILLLDRVRQERSVAHAEFALSPRHGPPIDVAATVAPISDSSGQLTGVSITARDISEQRWLAQALNQTLSALEEALREARESEARSRQFLADAAHQLRTPIAGIRACAETLLRGAPPADVDHILSSLVRETSRASRLMASLLRMARLDQGERVSPKRCDIVAVCKDEAERMLALYPNLTVHLGVETVADDRPSVDSHALREILSNLLDNARRHAKKRIEILVDLTDPYLEVRVVDDGPGLQDGDADRVFERFVSLDAMNGSGLGLPIARDLARNHGGDVVYADRAFIARLRTGPIA